MISLVHLLLFPEADKLAVTHIDHLTPCVNAGFLSATGGQQRMECLVYLSTWDKGSFESHCFHKPTRPHFKLGWISWSRGVHWSSVTICRAFNKTERGLEIKVLQLMYLLDEKNHPKAIIPNNLSLFFIDNASWRRLKFWFVILVCDIYGLGRIIMKLVDANP